MHQGLTAFKSFIFTIFDLMKIAVNTRLLLKDKLEGIGWFTYETLSRIAKNHPEHEFIFIFDRPFHKEFIFSSNVHPVVAGPPARHPFLFLIWFEFVVPNILKKYKADIFLSPDGYLSLSTKTPSVNVIHDLNFEHYPKDLRFFSRNYYKLMFPVFARKSCRIVTVSNYSAKDIANQYKINKNKIDVAYNGANDIFTPSDSDEQEQSIQEFTSGKPYLLYVGALNPRKNIINMLKAFDHYKKERPEDDIKLLVVGEKMWWNKAMDKTFRQMEYNDEVIFSGRMSPRQLRRAYGAAEALLYVSYFEGFGIPIIEAYRCHVPVITSNVTSMPEIAGDGALLVNPFDYKDISGAINRLRQEFDLKEQLIKAGAERANTFSWDKTASLLWDSIQKAIKQC